MQFHLSKALQLAYWDRGRPARTAPQARSLFQTKLFRASRSVRAGRPRSQYEVATEIKLHHQPSLMDQRGVLVVCSRMSALLQTNAASVTCPEGFHCIVSDVYCSSCNLVH